MFRFYPIYYNCTLENGAYKTPKIINFKTMENNTTTNYNIEAFKICLEIELQKVIDTPRSKLKKIVKAKKQSTKVLQQVQR